MTEPYSDQHAQKLEAFADQVDRKADQVIQKAGQFSHHAADVAVDRAVRPAVNAAVQTNRFLTKSLQRLEEDVHQNPVRSLAYAVGFGFLLGCWFRR